MSKDAPDLHDLPLTETTQATQTSLDLFNSFLNAPVKKLDADEYIAKDIDGVTEGVLGSGNMNFLMLQAGQTNESMNASNPFGIEGHQDSPFSSGTSSQSSYAPFLASGAGSDLSSNRSYGMPTNQDQQNTGDIGKSSNMAGSLEASTAANNSQSINSLTDTSGFSSVITGTATPPSNGVNGTGGTNGLNGVDGTGGGNTTVINNTIIDNTITNGDTNITLIDENLYTTVNNLVDNTTTLLTEVTNNAGDIVTTVVKNAGDIVTTVVNNAGDLLTTIVNNAGDIVNNVINNILDGNPLDIGPIGVSLDLTLDNLTNVTLDLINGTNILTIINEDLNLGPILTPVTDLTGDLLSSVSLDAIINPFQYDNSASDFDIHVGTGIDILGISIPDLALDIPLDPVEMLLGDIDIGLDITENLLGLIDLGGNADTDVGLAGLNNIADLTPVTEALEGVVNPVEDLVGDIDILGSVGLELLGLGNAGDGSPDTDITLPIELALVDSGLLSNGLEISLDPLENILGDIDLDLTVAANLLGNLAPGLIDSEAGGTGHDNILSDIGNGLSDIIVDLVPIGNNDGDTDLSLDTGIDLLGDGLLNDGLEVALDPVESLLGDIDIGINTGADLLNVFGGGDSTAPDDVDLSLGVDVLGLDLPPLELNLDLVESITGDIDLGISADADIVQNLSDGLHGLLNGDLSAPSLSDLPLLGDLGDIGSGSGLLEGLGNLDGLTGIISDLPGLSGGDAATGLLDGLLGTIDNTLDTAIGLLDSSPLSSGGLDLGALIPGSDSGLGGTLSSWTETLLPDAGNALGGGLDSALGGIVPDAISTITNIALPIAPIISVLPSGGGLFGGGLFGGGGHHGGGLFG